MLTPVLFQNTSVECVSLCAQEHTPFNIVPACLPALSTSVVMSLTCFDRTLPVFIYNSIVCFFFLCVYVHVSLFSIGIVQCKCMEQTGMGNFVGVLTEPHISKIKKGYLGGTEKKCRNVGDGINDKKKFVF